MTLGDLIRSARMSAGLTQVELGKKLNVSGSMVAQWEKNIRNPKMETIVKISNAIGRPFMDMLYLYSKETGKRLSEILDGLIGKNDSFVRETEENFHVEFSKDIDTFISSVGGRTIISAYFDLNSEGRTEAVKRVEELTEIPRYQKPKEAPAQSDDDKK